MASLNLKVLKLLLIFVYLMPGYYKANGRCFRRAAKETCPAGWSKWGNHCYKVIEHLEWANAKDKCIEIGGVMATPNTLEEHGHLRTLTGGYTWIDCNDIQEEGECQLFNFSFSIQWNKKSLDISDADCTFKGKSYYCRPDTSRRQRRRLPPCPWSLPWCPWNAPVEIYNFLIGCPLPRRKCLGALALSKTKHTGLLM